MLRVTPQYSPIGFSDSTVLLMMTDAPTTHASLLARLGDARDAEAWERFVELYAPPVYRFARRQGLQDADAADLTQDVLRNVSGAFRRSGFDARLGSFRSWLFTVVRNRLRDLMTSPKRREQGAGDTATLDRLAGIAAPAADPAQLWDEECERQSFAWAAEQVKSRFQPASWQAFWRTAVDGARAAEVAKELGITVAAVYLAKSRIMAAIKEQARTLETD
jgi:RNA polymerase sigma-70 factor (ECF subfamily)